MAFGSLIPFGRRSSLIPDWWRPDPFSDLRREIDRLFDDVFGGDGPFRFWRTEELAPRIDVREADDRLEVVADLPGVDEKDIDVEVQDDLLTIRGEKRADREERGRDYRLAERSFGRFVRSIRLPFAVDPDKVDASYAKGVLTVTVPKPPEIQQKTKRIPVHRADGQQSAA
jgi:HSP20 family protein